MTSLQWITPSGNLFTAVESINTSVAVVASGTSVSYSLLSGSLPPGLVFDSTGVISGIPNNVFVPTTSTFVIRATDTINVIDRIFKATILNNGSIQWITTASVISTSTNTFSTFLPAGYNGVQYVFNHQWINYPLIATPIGDPSTATITYYVSKGKLPPGLSLSSTGTISGFVTDDLTFNGFASSTGGYDTEAFDGYSYDPAVLSFYGTLTQVQLVSVPKIYQFSVSATDGYSTSTNKFEMFVASPDMFRADSEYLTFNNSIISTDILPTTVSYLELPQFLNNSDLGIVRAGKNTDLDVSSYNADPLEGAITYSLITTTNILTWLPADLKLDSTSGHIYGYIEFQPAYSKTYTLTVAATKADYLTTATATVTNTFTLIVQGDVYSSIEWITEGNLGSIETQIASNLYVKAKEISADFNINYQLTGGSLPTGLTLKQDGSISGSAMYNSTGTYTFTVLASDIYGLSAVSRDFVLSVTQSTSTEFTSVYIKPFMSLNQRQYFQDFITNTKIFNPGLIYRYFDTNFGVQNSMKLYLEFGIQSLTLDFYTTALFQNFYPTTLYFGDVGVAVAKDNTGEIIYEVVYVNIVDPQMTNKGTTVNSVFSQNDTVYYPASIANMRKQLETLVIGYNYVGVNEYSLPLFMRTPQTGEYAPPEYIPVIPLCYTLPGQSSKIVDRIKLSGFDFSKLNFEVDRIIVSSSQDNATDKYLIFKQLDISEQIPESFELFGPDSVLVGLDSSQGNSESILTFDLDDSILTDENDVPLQDN
jgi:hypothetical protein